MKLADAKRLAQPTPEDHEVIAEVRRNGGSLTAEEFAWTRVWDNRGCAWTGPRARRWAAEEEAKTGVPHVGTPDGRLYRLRAGVTAKETPEGG